MTKEQKTSLWLEYEAKRTNRTVEEVRKAMSERGKMVKPENRAYSRNNDLARQSGKRGGRVASGRLASRGRKTDEALPTKTK